MIISKIIFGVVCVVYFLISAYLSKLEKNSSIFICSMGIGLFLLPLIAVAIQAL